MNIEINNNIINDFIYKEIASCGRQIIFLTKYGSHLFGTNTETSDLDIKGVFLPSKEDVILQKTPRNISFGSNKNKNTKYDVDIELFSIYEFIKLGCEGQSIAIDMINIPSTNPNIIISSILWNIFIYNNKHHFYTKKLKSFFEYAKQQAHKYGNKGKRIKIIKNILELMNQYDKKEKMTVIWNKLPITEYSYFRNDLDINNKILHYECCGKILQSTTTIEYSRKILEGYLNKYGERAQNSVDGKDWKALSHALRAAFELEDIYKHGKIEFPLRKAKFLLKVKCGKIKYDIIQKILDQKIKQLTKLSERTHYPENVDIEFWNNIVYNLIYKYVIQF